MDSPQPKPKLLVIVGESGSGKSALAIRIAKEFRGEIISADSWAVYKDFNIGTAKPSEDDRKAVTHHLIDVTNPTAGFNAPAFKKLAEQEINHIREMGKLPIVVGGTGLYIDSLIFNYSFLPRSTKQERERLELQSIQNLIAEAKSKAINLEGIDIRNKRRIIRAIESGGKTPKKHKSGEDIYIIGLRIDREKLKLNIENRVNNMFKEGLETEVKRLSEIYGWDVEPMKGIGYKEFKDYFEGSEQIEMVKKRIVSNTLVLAKKQRTWFKRNPSIHWFDSQNEAYQEVYSILNT